jgi:hypothetical protein
MREKESRKGEKKKGKRISCEEAAVEGKECTITSAHSTNQFIITHKAQFIP